MSGKVLKTEFELRQINNDKKNAELEALVEKSAHGDDDALYCLCEKLATNVLFRTSLFLSDVEDAEGAARSILLILCENIRNLRAPKCYKSWLSGLVIDETRRRTEEMAMANGVVRIDEFMEETMEITDDLFPNEYGDHITVRQAVMEIVTRLPVRQREAVMLHYFDELSINEAAWVMDISNQNVTRYLALARKNIKQELGRYSFAENNAALSLASVGTLISEAFNSSSLNFVPADATWLQNALAQCREVIIANSAGVAAAASTIIETTVAAAKAPFGAIMGALTTIITAGAIALGITFGGAPALEPLAPLDIQPLALEGRIVFTGGDINDDAGRTNPGQADLQIDNTDGVFTPLQWWITAAGSDAVLYEGGGGDTSSVLRELNEDGKHGEYSLYFRFEDESGCIYRLGGNFYVTG